MQTLGQCAKLIRSKNAGPFWLTIDVMFDDAATYKAVRDQRVITAELMGRLYGQPAERISVFAHDAALAIKVSLPRPQSSGSPLDTDVFGGQQYAPLLDLNVDIDAVGLKMKDG
jgi:Domain of unknown function (DUF4387)